MNKEQIDKLIDALIKASTAMEKAISVLVGALPAKEDFDVLKKGDEDV